MLFVSVTDFPNTPLKLYPCSLLDHMRCLVRRRVQTRRPGKRHMFTRCVGLSPHLLRTRSGLAVGMGFDMAHIVSAERALDHIEVGSAPDAPLVPWAAASCTRSAPLWGADPSDLAWTAMGSAAAGADAAPESASSGADPACPPLSPLCRTGVGEFSEAAGGTMP